MIGLTLIHNDIMAALPVSFEDQGSCLRQESSGKYFHTLVLTANWKLPVYAERSYIELLARQGIQ